MNKRVNEDNEIYNQIITNYVVRQWNNAAAATATTATKKSNNKIVLLNFQLNILAASVTVKW
jgi:hypothetical protein